MSEIKKNMAKIQELIDENMDKLTDDIYKQLCDLTLKVYNEADSDSDSDEDSDEAEAEDIVDYGDTVVMFNQGLSIPTATVTVTAPDGRYFNPSQSYITMSYQQI